MAAGTGRVIAEMASGRVLAIDVAALGLARYDGRRVDDDHVYL
jgi:glycine/D-amino acid oxidase-like deaminating enzyme